MISLETLLEKIVKAAEEALEILRGEDGGEEDTPEVDYTKIPG